MDRIYIALRWLAPVALVAGLASAAMLALSIGLQYELRFGSAYISSFMRYLLVLAFHSLAFTLASGVTVLGIVAAWAEHRSGWLAALLVVALLAIAGPYAYEAWMLFHPVITSPSAPLLPVGASEVTTFTIDALSLVPVALILVFIRTARRADRSARLASDAALEITRSAL